MPLLFADTFYFIALLDSADAAHGKAIAWSRQEEVSFLTTEYVLIELGDAFHAVDQREEFVAFHEAIRSEPRFRIIPAHQKLYELGFGLYRRRRDREWQLTDCISFVVMSEHRVREALTGDQHFQQAGFRTLLQA